MLYFLKTSQQAPAQPQMCCCYPLGTVSAVLQRSLGFLISISTVSPNFILKLYSSGWRRVYFLNPIYLYSFIFLSKITRSFWLRIAYPRHTRNSRYLLNLNFVELLQSQLKAWYTNLPNFCFISLALAPSRTTPSAVAPFAKGSVSLVSHTKTRSKAN